MKRIWIAIAVLLIASLACSSPISLPGIGSSGGGGSTTVGPAPLFQDDFSDTNSGWDKLQQDTLIADYESGGYRVWENQANMIGWGLAHQDLPADVAIEVDATFQDGPATNEFGVLCRVTFVNNQNNFYYFLIGSDGYYGIKRVSSGQVEWLLEEQDSSDRINLGSVTNHLRAECNGSTLSLYANDNLLGSVTDTAITGSGDVALAVGTYDEAGVDVLFDNFVITAP